MVIFWLDRKPQIKIKPQPVSLPFSLISWYKTKHNSQQLLIILKSSQPFNLPNQHWGICNKESRNNLFWNIVKTYFIDIKNVPSCQVLIEDRARSDGWFSSDISWEPFCGILSDIDTISSDNIQDWGIKCEAWNCNQNRNDFLICSAVLIPTKYSTT